MYRVSIALAFFLVIALSGCTTTGPIPENYSGPTAMIVDSSANRVDRKGFLNPRPPKVDLFYAYKVNGKEIDTIATETYNKNQHQGFRMEVVPTERRVPVEPLTVEIAASTYHAAPVGVLFDKSYSVTGTVKFTPAAGQRYFVRGTLGENYSAVWIESAGGRVVTKKIEKRTQ